MAGEHRLLWYLAKTFRPFFVPAKCKTRRFRFISLRPVLLQKKRRYLEGDIWSIFLSVVQISTKYRLCSKRVKIFRKAPEVQKLEDCCARENTTSSLLTAAGCGGSSLTVAQRLRQHCGSTVEAAARRRRRQPAVTVVEVWRWWSAAAAAAQAEARRRRRR